MRKLMLAALLAVGLAPLCGGGAFAQGYSGPYTGTYTASNLPGQVLNIGLYFKQLTQNTMIAQYGTGSGVAGTCGGTVHGNVAVLTCRNATPSCPGTYRGRYVFSGETVT
jgi:hypothetical protein